MLFTLDSNRDGLINDADKADDIEEESQNPNDYVLYRGVYGSAGGANTVDHRPVAMPQGLHQVTWEAPDLPSGVYFLRLTGDESVTTHKTLRLK